ncbi:MAG: nuclear transport factor 2 family protein [Candidatus Acidiferrales bacterium]
MIAPQVSGQDSASASDETKNEVLKFEAERNQAILDRNTAVLNRMYADGITWVMSNGDLLNKQQELANIGSEKQRLFTIEHSDRQVHVFGNTVVLTATSHSSERYKGRMVTVPRRFTNVYVKQNGQWRLVVHAVTPLAGAKGDSSLPPADQK